MTSVVAPGNTIAMALFTAGMTMFSGSIYLLVLDAKKYKSLGPVTPIGGVALAARGKMVTPRPRSSWRQDKENWWTRTCKTRWHVRGQHSMRHTGPCKPSARAWWMTTNCFSSGTPLHQLRLLATQQPFRYQTWDENSHTGLSASIRGRLSPDRKP